MNKKELITKVAFLSTLIPPSDQRMDATLAQAAQPSPEYLNRAQNKGLLGKYYNDKMTQDYAVNPEIGDTGAPAKAIPLSMTDTLASEKTPPSSIVPKDVQYPAPATPQITPEQRFAKMHGSGFDPKSKMDIGKMKQIMAKYYNK